MIRLHNSRTRRKEDFTPIDPQNVRMYVCGPTVYDRAHLGNARPVVVFDVLYRLLRHVYRADAVTYVRNFTDVDDKINARAAQMQADGDARALNEIIRALTDQTIDWYHADMDALGALRPNHEPRATEYIVQMVAMIEGLVAKGHAYAAQGHVLFDVRSYPDYGKLSGRSLDDMIAGARVEVAPYKRDPMDFVLWKPSAGDEPGWDSPWGRGRPGWHIECSAMAHDLLGPAFDIHGGGIDLQFPHHENEIAQSCCAHPDAGFANFWLHNEMVQVEGKKMSKSLGNFFTVRDLLEQGWPGEVIRFVMLSTHYRSPMDWTEDAAERAEAKLLEFSVLLHRFAPNHVPNIAAVSKEVIQALSDDMNTYASLIALDQTFKRCIELGDARQLANDLEFLGITRYAGSPIEPEAEWIWELPQKINSFSARLQALKVEAIEKRDFSKVDQLKSDLSRIGIKVMMRKESVDLEIDYFAVYQNMLIERNDPRFNQLTGVDRREVAKWLEQKLDTLI